MQFKFNRNKVWLYLPDVLEISSPKFGIRWAKFTYEYLARFTDITYPFPF